MSRIIAVYLWDLMQGLRNRLMQVFALACVAGGTALLAAAPGRETLPLLLIQALLFFGSLFGILIGWGSGQQSRNQGAFLFAQPVGAGELIVGKLLGTATWCLLLLTLFMAPAAVQAGLPGTVLALGALAMGLLLVCLVAGLFIGLVAAPVTGLLAVLLAWAVSVAGWELGLLLLSEVGWIERMPWLFVALLLVNPAGAFRIGAMVGLDVVPFDADELDTGGFVFAHIGWVATAIFALWLVLLFALAQWRVAREEF